MKLLKFQKIKMLTQHNIEYFSQTVMKLQLEYCNHKHII